MDIVKVEFDGMTFEANADAFNNYRVAKWIALASERPDCAFKAFEAIFAGKDEQYAEQLGGDAEKMGELLNATFVAIAEHKDGENAKN